MEAFVREELLIGKKGLDKLNQAHVAVFGIGGVGGYCAEALVRAGIGNLTLFDHDIIAESNLNRQIIALHSTIGKAKVEVMKARLLDINPKLNIMVNQIYYEEKNAHLYDLTKFDYIIDAIDSVTSKIYLIMQAKQHNLRIISSMGTGNKLNPLLFEINDIYKTSVCPLAKVMRYELRKRAINDLKVVYSKEEPQKNAANIIGSISFVPSVAGLLIASEVIKDLLFSPIKD